MVVRKSRKPAKRANGRGETSARLQELNISKEIVELLAALDITRADQLLGAAHSPELRTALARQVGAETTDLDAAMSAAQAARSPAVTREAQAAAPRSFGALRPPPAAEAQAMSIPLATTRGRVKQLPTSANLVSELPAIRNQGSRGTCVAFGITTIHEHASRAKKHNFSERHLYYLAKLLDGMENQCGTFQEAASRALAATGQCFERTWAYNPAASCNSHGGVPPEATPQAADYRFKLTALNPHDVVAAKTAVAGGRPVGISIPVYNSWAQSPSVERSGRITMPIAGEPSNGGHCMCIVGYVDDGPDTVTETPGGGFFILRNSWSTTWGATCPFGAGYGTIPYAYIAAYNWESYTSPPARKAKRKNARRKQRRERL